LVFRSGMINHYFVWGWGWSVEFTMVSLPVIKVCVSVITQATADLGFFVRIFLVFFFWCIAKSKGICSFCSKLAIQEVFWSGRSNFGFVYCVQSAMGMCIGVFVSFGLSFCWWLLICSLYHNSCLVLWFRWFLVRS
jgi:hypothetical protein